MKKITTLLLALLLIASMMLGACKSSPAGGGSDASAASGDAGQISEFSSVDLDGNSVTQDVFSNAEITMINFWGTYCPPCIAEMPELAKLEGEYDGRLQLVGVPIDVDFTKPESEQYKSALEILGSAGAEFKNVAPEGGLADYVSTMQYVPTSIFVDPEGNIVGGPVVGGVFDEYRKAIDSYLESKDQAS